MANMNVNVTTNNTVGVNDLSPEMKIFYDKVLLREATPNLVHQQFGQKRPIPQGSGKTIEFRKFSSLPKALTALTEGVTPDGRQMNVTSITATVAQYGDYIVQSDVLELTALDNTIVEATTLLGAQAGLTLDTVVRNVLNAGTNVSYAQKTVSGSLVDVTSRASLDKTAKISIDGIERVVAKLRNKNAKKIGDSYICIVHPNVVYDLRRNAEWIDAHKYAEPSELYSGEVGRIAGVRFVESTEAKIFRGEDLASDSRTLTINHGAGYSGAITSVDFDGGTVAADALIGKTIVINGVSVVVTDNTASSITFDSTDFGTITDDMKIYPDGASDGSAVYSCLFLAENAYGVTEVTGGGLQTIVKQKGSAGTADPLDQRSSIGWKAMLTSEILLPENLVRFECCSGIDASAAN